MNSLGLKRGQEKRICFYMIAELRMSQLTIKCMQVLELSWPKPYKIRNIFVKVIIKCEIYKYLRTYFDRTCFLFAFYKFIL